MTTRRHPTDATRAAFKFPDVDVQGDAAKPPLSQSMQQSVFVDNLTARDVTRTVPDLSLQKPLGRSNG